MCRVQTKLYKLLICDKESFLKEINSLDKKDSELLIRSIDLEEKAYIIREEDENQYNK